MIARQFRLLLLSREVIDERGTSNQIIEALRGEPYRVNSRFVADKLFSQARQFNMRQLETIYRRLLAVDESIKTGQMDPTLALTTFIVVSCQ
ncbi:MAG TPA: hypothetical protein VHO48_03020 [Anaerolineaceae bacterium]|nr:hypothetical protein [Anaerolineaceae bacterium]